ncbi:uncharacterized protein LOC108702863 [Xenopus laevis]|uniref:PH domain-containing protein n=2 Tax=Xenopus laevis TaxID=8355 RepID=A0A974BTU2_XENLA|nr:uncharacterized protein LOC108702863 [Xenopus laevis]OCT60854.1 hypothetical protein XELAEV_18046876mg [Xenopus laevis]
MEENAPEAAAVPQIMESVKENLCFTGFLRKRKDTMKFTWAKYWFKLQNTTLYFYTRREAHDSSLRGQYYMGNVQSVRRVSVTDVEYPFEIVMKNGKRKILAADTADLRDVWMQFLWKSMQLPGPGRHNSSCTWYDIPSLVERVNFASGEGLYEELSPDSTLCDDVFGNLDKSPSLLHSADKGGQCSNSKDTFNKAQLPCSSDKDQNCNEQLPHSPVYCNMPILSALNLKEAFNTEQLNPSDNKGTFSSSQPPHPIDSEVTAQQDFSESENDSDYEYDVPRPVGVKIQEKGTKSCTKINN